MPDTDAIGSPAIAESLFLAAPDGLRLHVRAYGHASAPGLPVVCLPGLARTEADFEALAAHLASDPDRLRYVLALDYRGRGQSAYDPDWRNYTLATELADVTAVLTALEIGRAVFIGTSRGGLLTMLLAAVRPTLIAGAVLNDIGPVLDPKGLMRIKGYVGKIPLPKDFAEGAVILQRLFSAQFPKLSEADWLAWAKRSWTQGANGMAPRSDPQLANTLRDVGPGNPIPELWAQFGALAEVPLMAIRGALSDLLSLETLARMRQQHPDLEVLEVLDQGHAPLLAEPEVIARVAAFVRCCDQAKSVVSPRVATGA